MYSQVSYEILPFLQRQLSLFSLVLNVDAENYMQEMAKYVELN